MAVSNLRRPRVTPDAFDLDNVWRWYMQDRRQAGELFDLITSSRGVDEAPDDGNAYVRQSKAWEKALDAGYY